MSIYIPDYKYTGQFERETDTNHYRLLCSLLLLILALITMYYYVALLLDVDTSLSGTLSGSKITHNTRTIVMM